MGISCYGWQASPTLARDKRLKEKKLIVVGVEESIIASTESCCSIFFEQSASHSQLCVLGQIAHSFCASCVK